MVVGSAAGFLVNHLHWNTEIGSAKNFRGALSKLSIITDLLSVREWRPPSPVYEGSYLHFLIPLFTNSWKKTTSAYLVPSGEKHVCNQVFDLVIVHKHYNP